MPDDYTPYIQRHLARNIPLNFETCCEIVRAELEVEKRIRRRPDGAYRHGKFNRIYGGMIAKLVESGLAPFVELDNREIPLARASFVASHSAMSIE